MNQRHHAFLGALAIAVGSVACTPTEADTSTKVKANLTADSSVKAASIDVGVQKKTVTLTGTVDSAAIKEQAVAIARKTDGVGEVVDRLQVSGQWPGAGPGRGHDMMNKGMGSGPHTEAPKDEKRQ